MVKKRSVKLIKILLVCFLFLSFNLAQAAGKKTVNLDFNNVDIKTFIKFISEVTGKNFVIDKQVSGMITVISPTEISIDTAYAVFESVLDVQGFTAIPAGEIIKIVPSRVAKQTGIETRTGEDIGKAIAKERVITQLIPVKYIDAQEIVTLLRPLVSQEGNLVDHANSNTLILTDQASNIERLIKIITEIDIEGSRREIYVVFLEHASTDNLSKVINSVFQNQGISTPSSTKGAPSKSQTSRKGVQAISDARTNGLIILATPEEYIEVQKLIKELDVRTPKGKGKIKVCYLENAVAEDVANVLTKVPKQQTPGAKGGVSSLGILGDVSITADKATNALIIVASPEDYAILEEVIKGLDIIRSQVLVEALIAEISWSKMLELGVEWRTMDMPKDGSVSGFGGTDFGLIDQATQGSLSGVLLGITRGYLDDGIPNIGALLQAFAQDSDVNVLSTPHILTTDNEEAQIVVGDVVPYITGTQTTDSSSVTNTYDYKDVGITLKITPHISRDKFVRLELFQEIKNLISTSKEGAPTTTKREAQTTVIVKDGETIVIGGLISENTEETVKKVPCLGDIPLLGYLFQSKKQEKKKTNLVIFITPHIITNPEDLRELTEQKRKEMEMIKKENEEAGTTDEKKEEAEEKE